MAAAYVPEHLLGLPQSLPILELSTKTMMEEWGIGRADYLLFHLEKEVKKRVAIWQPMQKLFDQRASTVQNLASSTNQNHDAARMFLESFKVVKNKLDGFLDETEQLQRRISREGDDCWNYLGSHTGWR
ncbi:MAG: hypothetical protein Q9199_008121 [Rusavskia elegans]